MPVKWTIESRYQLLIKLIEQNPGIRCDPAAIAADWPGPDKVTPRAIAEQWRFVRKQAGLKGTRGPRPTAQSSPARSRTPTTPTTPALLKTQSLKSLITPNKRIATTNVMPGSSTKKRKIRHGPEDEEEPELPSSAEEVDADATDNDSGSDSDAGTSLANAVNPAIATRTLPARSKSRSKSYAIDNDSAGEDAGAEQLDSDDDSEFDLVKDAESRLTKQELKEKRWAQVREQHRERKKAAAAQAEHVEVKEDFAEDQRAALFSRGRFDGGSGDFVDGNAEDAADEANEVASQATKRTSWKSALEHMDDMEEI